MSNVLSCEEILPNIYFFMIAGYETTSTALAYCTYVLATRPDIQDKVVHEIDQHDWNSKDEEHTYEIVTNLSYLELFIREVLRMYPITFKAIRRECNTTATVCGHIIEEGLFDLKIIKRYNYLFIDMFCCR
jgi:cytochrome P450 family 13